MRPIPAEDRSLSCANSGRVILKRLTDYGFGNDKKFEEVIEWCTLTPLWLWLGTTTRVTREAASLGSAEELMLLLLNLLEEINYVSSVPETNIEAGSNESTRPQRPIRRRGQGNYAHKSCTPIHLLVFQMKRQSAFSRIPR